MKHLLTICIAAFSLASASAGTTWEKLTVNGQSRDIKVHVPDNTPAGASLVIACHGMNQSADWHDSNSKWTAVSDTAKFVLVFPEGIDHGWDIGGNRDVDLVCAIIDKMEKDHKISTARVYLTGFSMGGMFTYHCANRIPDKIAAFVPVSGYPMWDKSVYSPRPVPIMHVHGTGDDVCVFSGVQPTLDNWIKHNECNSEETLIDPYPKGNPNKGAKMHIWGDGVDGVEVRLLEFAGKGHWQSEDPVFCLTSIEAWNFMQRWSLRPEPPRVKNVVPEDGSFDLPDDGYEITLTFDKNVNGSEAEALLTKDGTSIKLDAKSSGNILTLTVPALEHGEYVLSLSNLKGENDCVMDVFKATYSFGVEEVGDFDIANPKTAAERYKGTFQLTLKQAKELYASFPEENINRVAAKKLKYVIDKYENLVSTSPKVYEQATADLADAIAKASSLAAVAAIEGDMISEEYFNLHGQRIDSTAKGVVIVRTRYSDGAVKTQKSLSNAR